MSRGIASNIGHMFWYVSCETEREDPFFGDKTLCVEKNITFNLKAYKSHGFKGDQNSGAYIF